MSAILPRDFVERLEACRPAQLRWWLPRPGSLLLLEPDAAPGGAIAGR